MDRDLLPSNRPERGETRTDSGEDPIWAVTMAGPDSTAYPKPGDGTAVYYCRRLIKVSYAKSVGTSTLTSTNGVQYPLVYLVNPLYRWIPPGTKILIEKVGAQYFTRDGRGGPFLGKTDAAIAKGASGNVSIFVGGDGVAKGSESDTGINASCYNRFADVESGRWVMFDWVAGGLELTAAEC